MTRLAKILVTIVAVPVGIVAIAAAALLVAASTADYTPPTLTVNPDTLTVTDHDTHLQCGPCLLRRNSHGLWEMYLEGSPMQRGFAYAKLAPKLIQQQEDVFAQQIMHVVPSAHTQKIFRLLVSVFCRNITSHIPAENREEIYGMSSANADSYPIMGTSYERQLNYHAAHDIGHAMQDYMLVGCTSFAAWDSAAYGGEMIMARNFDFHFGDDFARNKMVSVIRPDSGYAFVSVSWPGMMGAVSGLNEQGLAVTINASKGEMATAAKTPVSILARIILQYAATIDEAMALAQQYDTFVSESFLVASAIDNRAAIIEKTPATTALYRSPGNTILCTNHYQSSAFANSSINIDNIANTDSYYRWQRLREMVDSLQPISVADAAQIMRDRHGLHGTDIGIGNEKSINQFICHHSVVIAPQSRRIWVSTAPWQLGEYLCYSLDSLLHSPDFSREISLAGQSIPADSAAIATDAMLKTRFGNIASQITEATVCGKATYDYLLEQLVAANPNYYRTYEIIADYYALRASAATAIEYYRKALSLEIPHTATRLSIENKIKELSE